MDRRARRSRRSASRDLMPACLQGLGRRPALRAPGRARRWAGARSPGSRRRGWAMVSRRPVTRQASSAPLAVEGLSRCVPVTISTPSSDHPALDVALLQGVSRSRPRPASAGRHQGDLVALGAQLLGHHGAHVVVVVVEDHDRAGVRSAVPAMMSSGVKILLVRARDRDYPWMLAADAVLAPGGAGRQHHPREAELAARSRRRSGRLSR